ncbi:MAG TPA: amidohydrolase [Clostridiales bacterium]|mgnify:CR=1 FL=1|nr:amidohydrolase [Clostridiales bacterium]HQP69034.1 amidohydrolase [Clostridiales bacterium]
MTDLIKLRKELHSIPEASGKERKTTEFIVRKLKGFKPDSVMNIRGSVIAVFKGNSEGKITAFRCDIDALPVKGSLSHLCGHDGHSAILLGLAEMISERRPVKGSAVLIFQSAEETGQGALKLTKSKEFRALRIDNIFGFHNIPGYKEGEILLKSGPFAMTSTGMIISFTGKTSHASEPEKGISPVPAISWLIRYIGKISSEREKYFGSGTMITVVGMKAGRKNFGISPDKGEIYLTLRSEHDEDMTEAAEMIEAEARRLSDMSGLTYKISFKERFPAVINDAGLTKILRKITSAQKITMLEKPFPWSEDFGHYARITRACLFGFGTGKKHPPLHAPEYEFNDNIIKPASDFLYELYLNSGE